MTDHRKKTRAPLDIYLNKYLDGVPYMARTANISPDGVGLSHLIEPDHEGKRVGLQFQLPGSAEIIYAEGEVVREWVVSAPVPTGEEERSGIRFTLLTERHRRMIGDYVQRHDERGS